MKQKRNKYSNEYKAKVVLEVLQRDTTIEQVRQRFGVHTTQINSWTKLFKQNVPSVFEQANRKPKPSPEQSVEELQKIIGKLTIENEILKKALESLD